MMGVIEIFLRVCIAGFALLLLIPSIISWWRIKHYKLLAVCAAFLIFFLKGMFLVIDWLCGARLRQDPYLLTLDFLILLLLYFAVVKR